MKKLYESLCEQDCKNFEWLIIDDGSKDDTEKFVEQMKMEADFLEFCLSVHSYAVDFYC